MIILLWLVPPVLVTVVAMLWVSWWGRDSRGAVDPEEALARLGAALAADPRSAGARSRPGYAVPPRPEDRSTGVAVRLARPDPSEPTTEPSPERRAS